MSDQDAAEQASALDMARKFQRAVWGADRVLVETRNALGEMDVYVFPADVARLVMPLPAPPTGDE